ncbi:hypothetical protein THIOM_004283 [Candidatus Thiomargarita nelsonii]|uniref:Roadblock/LAMTOR2 domain-containing protein n=1 Tax=Candidatus Thiomargarita nelsonii TaxID=1003181 RepID=A0A176RW92_9GAMM|nr:hypothetical protein THIOM_004283 [Candidatus Thiomargarita nelsonii]
MEALLAHLSQDENFHNAVLADKQGMLIAAADNNEDCEDLAAIAAMFDDLIKKIPQTLLVSTIQQLKVVDENGVTITVQSFQVASEQLFIVSLTVGAEPNQAMIAWLINEVSILVDKLK